MRPTSKETVVVLIALLAVASIGLPSFLRSLEPREDVALRRVIADLQRARGSARRFRVLDDHRYLIGTTTVSTPLSILEPSGTELAFDGGGRPTSGQTIRLAGRGSRFTLRIDQVNGRIKVVTP